MRHLRSVIATLGVAGLVLSACGDDGNEASAGDSPTVAVTTNILGDVVENATGGAVDVVVLMPVGVDPHQFQPSARQIAEVSSADAMVVNGGGFETGLVDVIASAESDGIPVIAALDTVEPLDAPQDHAEHADAEHADDEHADQDGGHEGHDHDGADPHFFTDPARMADAVDAIAEQLIATVDGIDADAIVAAASAYEAELRDLAAEVEATLAVVDDKNRTLITTHDVLTYFADAYEFRVVGTIIPTASTSDAASASQLADLAEIIEREDVPAVFVDASAATGLAETLADEAGDVDLVELFTESLGPSGSDGATYVDMIRTNADRIAAALG